MFFKLFSLLLTSLTSSHLFSTSHLTQLLSHPFSSRLSFSHLFAHALNFSHLIATSFLLTPRLVSAFVNFSHMLSTFPAFSQPFSHPFLSCFSAAQLFAQALDFSRLISTLFSPLLVWPQLLSTFRARSQLLSPHFNSSQLLAHAFNLTHLFPLFSPFVSTLLISPPLSSPFSTLFGSQLS